MPYLCKYPLATRRLLNRSNFPSLLYFTLNTYFDPITLLLGGTVEDDVCHVAYRAHQIEEPTTMEEALSSETFQGMEDSEYESLMENDTWELVELAAVSAYSSVPNLTGGRRFRSERCGSTSGVFISTGSVKHLLCLCGFLVGFGTKVSFIEQYISSDYNFPSLLIK